VLSELILTALSRECTKGMASVFLFVFISVTLKVKMLGNPTDPTQQMFRKLLRCIKGRNLVMSFYA